MSLKQEDTRKNILYTYQNNSNLSCRELAKELRLPKSTIYNVIKSFKIRLTVVRKSGSGKNRRPSDPKMDKKVVKIFEKNPNLSVRAVAQKVGMSSSYVQKVKKRNCLKAYKVQAAPNRNDKQNLMAKTRTRKLYTEILTKNSCVIMDDETYVLADFKQLPGQTFYTAKGKKEVLDEFRTQKLSKFPKKYLVWQAICSCGRKSRSFFTTGTINQEIYLKECLQKRLLPFINSHETSTVFWPDLASCHYAKSVLEWYEANRIQVVPKICNPPNCPELRPIETYWAIVKQKLKKCSGEAKDLPDFKKKWVSAAKKVSDDTVQNLMAKVRSKARQFYQNQN